MNADVLFSVLRDVFLVEFGLWNAPVTSGESVNVLVFLPRALASPASQSCLSRRWAYFIGCVWLDMG